MELNILTKRDGNYEIDAFYEARPPKGLGVNHHDIIDFMSTNEDAYMILTTESVILLYDDLVEYYKHSRIKSSTLIKLINVLGEIS